MYQETRPVVATDAIRVLEEFSAFASERGMTEAAAILELMLKELTTGQPRDEAVSRPAG